MRLKKNLPGEGDFKPAGRTHIHIPALINTCSVPGPLLASEDIGIRHRSISGVYNLVTEETGSQEGTASDSENLLGADDAPSTYCLDYSSQHL